MKKLLSVVLVCFLLISSFFAIAPAALASEFRPDTYYHLNVGRTTHYNREFESDIVDYLFLDGGNSVTMYPISGTDRQLWKITDVGNGYYTIQSKENGKFLEGGGTVALWDWTGTDRQYWKITRIDSFGTYSLQSKENNKYLDGGSTVNMWDWSGTERQRWNISS